MLFVIIRFKGHFLKKVFERYLIIFEWKKSKEIV